MENIKENKEMNLKEFYLTDLNEQETIINIDYYGRVIYIYTCRKHIAERLQKKLGQPTKVYFTNNRISAVRYELPFNKKREISSVLSRPLLIGNMR